MLKLTTPNEPGFYMPFVREPDGSLEILPDVREFLSKHPHHVVRNLKGDIVKLDLTQETFEPKSFADYFLYVFEHAFVRDPEKSIMVFNFLPDTPFPCSVCGEETHEYYPEPLQSKDAKEDVIIYAICEECWEDTHIAHIVGHDE